MTDLPVPGSPSMRQRPPCWQWTLSVSTISCWAGRSSNSRRSKGFWVSPKKARIMIVPFGVRGVRVRWRWCRGVGRARCVVEGGAEGLHQSVDVLFEEEFAVAEDAAGIVEEGDQSRALAGAGGAAVGSEHGVGLPELVGEFHAEGEALFVVGVVGGEQVVIANEAVEGGLGDAIRMQKTLF